MGAPFFIRPRVFLALDRVLTPAVFVARAPGAGGLVPLFNLGLVVISVTTLPRSWRQRAEGEMKNRVNANIKPAPEKQEKAEPPRRQDRQEFAK